MALSKKITASVLPTTRFPMWSMRFLALAVAAAVLIFASYGILSSEALAQSSEAQAQTAEAQAPSSPPAQALPLSPTQHRDIHVEVSKGTLIELQRPVVKVLLSDAAIADVQVPTPLDVFVLGKKSGTTTLYALDAEGHQVLNATVTVSYDVAELRLLLQQDAPNSQITLASTPSGLIVSGIVPDAETAEKVRTTASRYVGEKEPLLNRLKVAGPQQVNLRVRVLEVDRQVTQELGFNWDALASAGAFTFGLATGRDFIGAGSTIDNLITRAPPPTNVAATPGSFFANIATRRANVNTLIDALNDHQLITILAEPNLTAISGRHASFLAGGEFPVPVLQSNSNGTTGGITIQFQQFGVMLDFVPTVLSSDNISITVRPEVSQLSDQGAITLQGITIPALTVRRAETTINLGSGQSFAIAGLIQNNTNTDVNKYPGLGDIPILGTMFRSNLFQRGETELVIVVTPYVVRPTNPGELRGPTDGFEPATELERIFLQRFNAGQLGLTGERLRGDAGFIMN